MPQGTGKSGNGIGGERQVIDFNEMRAQKLEEKRRKTERIFFKHLLSVYTVVGNGKQMAPIEIIDISEEGLAFQVPFNPDKPWPTQTPLLLSGHVPGSDRESRQLASLHRERRALHPLRLPSGSGHQVVSRLSAVREIHEALLRACP
jgi:hypothetical protein